MKRGWVRVAAMIGAIVACVLSAVGLAWAQDASVVSEGNDILALLRMGLTSIPGIVALSMALMLPVKKYVGTIRVLQDLPAWLYVIVTSLVLTVVANQWLGTLDGEMWPLIRDAFFAAAMASGLRDWWEKWSKSLGDTAAAREAMERKARG